MIKTDREVRLRFDATVVEDWNILDTKHLPPGEHIDVSPDERRYSITKIINMDVNLVQLGWVNENLGGSVADVMVFLADHIVGKLIPDSSYPDPGLDRVTLNLIEKIRLEANEVFDFAADYEAIHHPIRRYIKDVDVFQVGGPMTKEWKERNSVDGISYDHLMDPQFAAGKRPWDDDWYDTPNGDTNPEPHRGKTGDLQ
jgi:hypothetical protein